MEIFIKPCDKCGYYEFQAEHFVAPFSGTYEMKIYATPQGMKGGFKFTCDEHLKGKQYLSEQPKIIESPS